MQHTCTAIKVIYPFTCYAPERVVGRIRALPRRARTNYILLPSAATCLRPAKCEKVRQTRILFRPLCQFSTNRTRSLKQGGRSQEGVKFNTLQAPLMAVSRPGLVRATLGSAERGWQRLELQPHHRGPEPATPGRRPEQPPLMEAAGLPSHQRPGYNLRSPRCPALSLAAPCGHGRGGQLCEGSGGGLSPPQGLGSACLQVLPQNILLNIRVRIY